jgi:hypothetical protein
MEVKQDLTRIPLDVQLGRDRDPLANPGPGLDSSGSIRCTRLAPFNLDHVALYLLVEILCRTLNFVPELIHHRAPFRHTRGMDLQFEPVQRAELAELNHFNRFLEPVFDLVLALQVSPEGDSEEGQVVAPLDNAADQGRVGVANAELTERSARGRGDPLEPLQGEIEAKSNLGQAEGWACQGLNLGIAEGAPDDA